MRKKGRIILPGEKGFDDEKHKTYLFNQIRRAAGIPVQKKVGLEVHGWVLYDLRSKPPVSIWKNCTMVMAQGFKPPLPEQPMPFQYLEEALAAKAKMHLSIADEPMVKVAALCPEPPISDAMPDTIWIDKKDAKNR